MNEPELIRSLQKDFSIIFPEKISREKLKQQLSVHINHLITHDFNQLVNYLYRIDVDEEKLKGMLSCQPGQDAGLIIADLIIERQIQKLHSRESFTKKKDEMDEEDKW